jgi:hypothetical protein
MQFKSLPQPLHRRGKECRENKKQLKKEFQNLMVLKTFPLRGN